MQYVQLSPLARPVRRGPDQVQFGDDPTSGMIVAGLGDAEVSWLLGLTLGETADSLQRRAHDLGVEESRCRALLRLLRSRHLLVDTPEKPSSAPGHLSCTVRGPADLVEVLADHLREIPEVRLCLDTPAAASAARIALAVEVLSQPRSGQYRFTGRHQAGTTDRVLPVLFSGTGRTVVGPLVSRRRGPLEPCLHCLDLYYADSPGPHVTGAPDGTGLPSGIDAITAATALTTRIVGLCARGEPAPPGISWEWGSSWPSILAREWAPHPLCDCGA